MGIVLVASLLASFCLAADPLQEKPGPGIETLAQTCTGCHGPGGVSPGSIPSLAGRPFIDIVERLQAFRNGHHPGTVMARFMRAFSDDDVVALAAYFSRMPSPANPDP